MMLGRMVSFLNLSQGTLKSMNYWQRRSLKKLKQILLRRVDMEMEGRIWKEGKFWIIEVPALDAMTQAKTRKEALNMLADLVIEMARSYFEAEVEKGLSITIHDYKKDAIGVTASNNRLFLALSLRRQREKSGSTVREASQRLGSKSPNAYAQYEKGKTSISIDKYEALLTAANPFEKLKIRIA